MKRPFNSQPTVHPKTQHKIQSVPQFFLCMLMMSATFTAGAFSEEPEEYAAAENDTVTQIVKSASSGQYNLYSRPEPLYKTPEAQAFQEYGSFGNGGSNGVIDISIPIHTVSCRDLQIPISLHYGGGGIRVSDEASWVGLGWDLSVGACINRIAAGQIDHLVRNSQWTDYQSVLNLNSAGAFQTTADYSSHSVMGDLANGMGERDFYSVNLFGKSFLFFTNPMDGKVTVIGAEDDMYSISRSGADGWLVRDAMGYCYDFSVVEYSYMEGAGMQISAIYLSSMDTPQGITANFSYETTSVRGIPQAYQWYDVYRSATGTGLSGEGSFVYDFPRFGSGASFGNTEIQKPWLRSISTDNQTVTFELGDRTDYKGSKKVDYIRVSDINGDTAYLHHFNYSTFSHSTVGGSCPDTSGYLDSDAANGERLKLTSISTLNTDRSDSLTYVFAYNEKYPLPLKTSAAIDFWGYYNGQENKSVNPQITDSRSLIPSLQDCTIGYTTTITPDNAAMSTPGACRFSDPERMLSGTLSSITYPTGGKSVFTFEPHRFSSAPVYPLRNIGYRDVNMSVEDINYPADDKNPGPVFNRRLDISGTATGYITVTFEARSGKKLRQLQQANAKVSLQPMASSPYRKIEITLDSCSNVNLDATYHTQTFAVSLETVSYMVVADLPAQIAYGDGYVKATLEIRDIDKSLESGGGGLRIASVENFNESGSLIGSRNFSYTNSDGTTAGRLIVQARPTECRVKYLEHLINSELDGAFKNYVRTPVSAIRINSSLHGGPSITSALSHGTVAYSCVTENECDATGQLIRSVSRNFKVETADEVYPDMHLLTTFGGGELTGETISDAGGNIMKSVTYEYSQKSTITIKCNIMMEDRYYEYLSDLNTHIAPRYLLSIYPYKTFWRVLSAKRTREQTKDGIREISLTYSYNGSNHLISEENETSGGVGTRTTYRYPVDYTTSPYTSMCSTTSYLLGVPVEVGKYRLSGGAYSESGKIRYDYSFRPRAMAMLLLESVQESVAGGTLFTSESYTYSEDDGTLVGAAGYNSPDRTFLWSYGHTCPVVSIEGASYSEVVSWMGSSFVSTLSATKDNSVVESLLSRLRTTLQDKGLEITTYTHQPLVGITSETRPNGERITYEYDGFNRLSRVCDSNGNTIENIAYSYK